jgi:uncharacterized RmlC-like cupin family protein
MLFVLEMSPRRGRHAQTDLESTGRHDQVTKAGIGMTTSPEEQFHPSLDPDGTGLNSEREPGVRVIRPEDFDTDTTQTSGMQRLAAISSKLVGAQGICAGITVIEKHAATGLHHHGNQETVIYVKSGQAQVRWGAHLQQEALVQAGSFAYIPAYLPHQELNPSPDTVSEWVIVRNGPEPIVVNLEGVPGAERADTGDTGGGH